MKNVLMIGLFLLGGAAFAQDAAYTYYPSGAIQTQYIIDGSEVNKIDYFETGAVKETGMFINNLKEGRWVRYDESGAIISEANFKAGKRDGLTYVKADDGAVMYEIRYNNNNVGEVNKWAIAK